ncbi:TrmH family RNA methyltransferase [Rosistilla oblonga]|uniref:23S rRNA (Uridine(2479)-2'-O)-methyltransferase n=1 Tax=Rosistilla oblonga TaxID=2527990 RepID=A0A518IQB5_9BACT|nr:TrmH family RNA methyltransferase [Rosistilla oblonga]QDV55291.1 23S rRNA (uridine(2479)-2'-O)-methyltransferase [Rosistilla oblonga]
MPLTITSRSNPRYRGWVQLRSRRARKRSGEFLIDGARDTLRAIQSGILPREILCSADCDLEAVAGESELGQVLAWAEANDALIRVASALFPAVCYGQRDSHVVAVASAASSAPLDGLSVPLAPLIVILDGIEKPGNVGAIYRTADAVGADAVLLTGTTTDRFNPNAIRSSAGTVFAMPTAIGDHDAVAKWLADRKIKVALARVDGECSYWDLPLTEAIAIVFGNEAEGLGTQWERAPHEAFRIPMAGIADSLNVSVSAAVVLFEAKRQRLSKV